MQEARLKNVASVGYQPMMHLVPILLQERVHAGKRTFHRKTFRIGEGRIVYSLLILPPDCKGVNLGLQRWKILNSSKPKNAEVAMLRSVCLWLSCSCFLLIRIALADPPPEAVVSHPVVHEVVDYGDFVGRAEAVNSVDLRARVSGYLVKSLFKPGGAVRQGDLLFEIDPRPYQAEVEKRKAETQLAAARVRRLAADLQRLGKPIARGAVSAEDLDRTRAELEEAEAALPVAQARCRPPRWNWNLPASRPRSAARSGCPA